MKYALKTSLIILSLFFLAQIFGLYIIDKNIAALGAQVFEPGEEAEATVYVLPVIIAVITFLFLLLFKLKLNKLLVVWYSLAFISCVSVTLASFINEVYAIIIAFALLLLRFDTRDNFFHNMSELLVYAGLAVLMLSSVDLNIMIFLLAVISIYDVIAVNMSRHMVALAKSQLSLNIFSGLKIEADGAVAALGGGDVVFPLLLAGVMLRDYSALSAIMVAYGSLIGLIILILVGDENKAYPAMPFITAGSCIGLILGLFV